MEMAGQARLSMRKVSSSAALKELKQVAKKEVKSIKGIMKKVGVQKVE